MGAYVSSGGSSKNSIIDTVSLIEIIIGVGHFHFGLPAPERVTCLLCEQLGVVVSLWKVDRGEFYVFHDNGSTCHHYLWYSYCYDNQLSTLGQPPKFSERKLNAYYIRVGV